MKFSGIRQLILGAVAATTATGIVVYGAMAYQAGWDYTPTGENRALNVNQVVFPDGDKTSSQQQSSENNSELWQKDETANETDRPQQSEQADYLFEEQKAAGVGDLVQDTANPENPDATSVSKTATIQTTVENTSQAGQTGGTADIIYDVTGDASNADLIISGGTGNTAAGSDAQQPSVEPTPQPTAKPEPGATPAPSSTPAPAPSTKPDSSRWDNISDAEGKKTEADYAGTGVYNPAQVAKKDIASVDAIVMQNTGSAYSIYAGQKMTKRALYNALDTRVIVTDTAGEKSFYLWGNEQLGVYFNIDAVSFDGGKTWITEFPVTVPSVENMLVKTSYRLGADQPWVSNKTVSYDLEQTRVYVLREPLDENATSMDEAAILNPNNAAPKVGDVLNLYYYQFNMLGEDQTTQLYTGWTENGKTVPFFYPVTSGRHFLEPGAFVDLADLVGEDNVYNYTIQLEAEWPDGKLVYYQTLTNYYGDWGSELNVPAYVQAVDFSPWAMVYISTLTLPDTVEYVDISAITVFDGFAVDEGNTSYTVQDNLLYTKDGKAIVGIPYSIEEMTVPAGVTSIAIPTDNSLSSIVLEAEEADELPEINLDNLGTAAYGDVRECDIILKNKDVLMAFVAQNYAALNAADGVNLYCADGDLADRPVVVKNDCLMMGDTLMGVMNCDAAVLLPDGVSTVEPGTLALTDGSYNSATALVLPQDGKAVALADGWNDGSDVSLVLCYTQEQAKAAEGCGAQIRVLDKSKEGAYYFVADETVLVKAPSGMKEFSGTLTAQDGKTVTVTRVGDRAFADNTNLEWVSLPKETTYIGYEAFQGCASLQGALFDTRDTITIGDRSFDGCDALRFVASNALNAEFKNWYNIPVNSSVGTSYNMFRFVLPDANGYDSWVYLNASDSGNPERVMVDHYELVDCGGVRVLYLVDNAGKPWLALRSGAVTSGDVKFPADTIEIFNYALADVHKADDSAFGTNLTDLSVYLDEGAFSYSGIGPNLVLPEDTGLGDAVFNNCGNIETLVISDGIYLGLNSYDSNVVFNNCTKLREVTIGNLGTALDEYDQEVDSVIAADMFYECDNLEAIHFLSETPPELHRNYWSEFSFNSSWNYNESEQLEITVPDGCIDKYLEAWRYGFCGYTSNSSYYPARTAMWQQIQLEAMDPDTGELPTDDEVDELFKAELLSAENHLRAMLGLDLVTEPSNTYYFHYSYVSEDSADEICTLVRVSPDVTAAILTPDQMGMPAYDHLDYIAADAFADCTKLEHVTLPDELQGIYSGAFRGVGYDEQDSTSGITIYSNAVTPPALLGVTDGTPFSFGVPDARVEFVFAALREQDVLDAWTLPMAGYTSMDALTAAVTAELYPDGTEIDADKVQEAVEAVLADAQNRVRTVLFGVEPIPVKTTRAADVYILATPETALPVEADSVGEAPAGGDTAPAQDTPADEPTASPADEPVQELPGPATPETAATEGKESNE